MCNTLLYAFCPLKKPEHGGESSAWVLMQNKYGEAALGLLDDAAVGQIEHKGASWITIEDSWASWCLLQTWDIIN